MASLKLNTGVTSLIHLSPAPLWSPPAMPTYEAFRRPDPVGREPEWPSGEPVVYPSYSGLILNFALPYWAICAATAVIYSTLSSRCRDLILEAAKWTAIIMTSCAALSFSLWIAFGGWGPPALELFAMIGIAVGPLIGYLKQDWTGRAAEILAEKRSESKSINWPNSER